MIKDWATLWNKEKQNWTNVLIIMDHDSDDYFDVRFTENESDATLFISKDNLKSFIDTLNTIYNNI